VNETTDSKLTSRSIRSFVIRKGRLTKAQAAAMQTLLPKYGVSFDAQSPIDATALFGRVAPLWVEIGFGNGDALIDMALRYPDTNFIGIEVHEPGVGQALSAIEANHLTNVRVMQHDAVEILQQMFTSDSIDRVLLFFPDPWRKKRHFKRRIVQKDFVDLVASRLVKDGVFHCASDWQDYAEWILERLDACDMLVNQTAPGEYSPRPEWRTNTRFEQRGTRLGHSVFDLLFTRR